MHVWIFEVKLQQYFTKVSIMSLHRSLSTSFYIHLQHSNDHLGFLRCLFTCVQCGTQCQKPKTFRYPLCICASLQLRYSLSVHFAFVSYQIKSSRGVTVCTRKWNLNYAIRLIDESEAIFMNFSTFRFGSRVAMALRGGGTERRKNSIPAEFLRANYYGMMFSITCLLDVSNLLRNYYVFIQLSDYVWHRTRASMCR